MQLLCQFAYTLNAFYRDISTDDRRSTSIFNVVAHSAYCIIVFCKLDKSGRLMRGEKPWFGRTIIR